MPLILNRQALAVLSCFLPLSSAIAQSPQTVGRLDSIVVTASRSAQLQKDVQGDVTVIDKQELQRAGQSSLAEVLARHHDVQFYNNGGPQTVTGVFLRGTSPAQTLVLVDGVRINSSVSGSTNWAAIDPAVIERIEILRGSASGLYGSDAMGGVINIITNQAQGGDRPPSAWANMGIGSYGTVKSSAGISGAQDGWNYSISGNMARSDGFNATNKDAGAYTYNRDADGYDLHGFSASLGYRWKPGHHLGVTAYNSYIRSDIDVGDYPEHAYALTRQQVYTATSTNQLADYWNSTLRFGLSKETSEDRSWGTRFSTLQRSYTWQNDFKLTPDQNVSALLERLEERVAHTGNYTNSQRNTNAVGLIYRGDFGAHHLQANLRNDNISSYGNQVTGGLAYDLDLTENWKVGVSGNTGFRAPTFSDLYYPYDGGSWGSFQGNPDLKPEKSRNIEARLSYETDTTRLGVVVFQNKIRDLINGYVCDVSFDCTAMNTERATIRGITLTGEQVYGDTTLRASADFLDPRNDRPRAGETGSRLVQRARQVYRFSAEQRYGALTVGGEYQFTGKRYSDVANQVLLGGYGLFNMTAAYAFSKNVEVQARWNNIFNKEYSNSYGYRNPGSNFFINLSLRM